jgi:hypothetical protein
MRLASFAFFVLLLHAHATGDLGELLAQPLSMFRDGPWGWIGYTLFALLLLIGSLYTRALVRTRHEVKAAASAFAVLLLLIVTLTPSWGGFHYLCSLLLLVLLYGYYALLLREAESPWRFLHWAVPVVLAILTRFHSYGIWQKSFVAYFVLLANLHHVLLARGPVQSGPSPPGRCVGRGEPIRRRTVYRLEPGPAWGRRK